MLFSFQINPDQLQASGEADESFPNELKQLEVQRKKVHTRLSSSLVIGMILFIILIFIVANSPSHIQTFMTIGTLALGVGYYLLFLRKPLEHAKEFKRKLRTLIIHNIIQKIDPGTTYHPTKFIGKDDFIASDLFNKIPTYYSGSNYFRVPQENYLVEFSDVTAKLIRSNDQDTILLFAGLLFVFTLDKQAPSRTLITHDFNLGAFEFITDRLENKKYSNYSRVKINNEEFEEQFNIFGNNISEATRLVTPKLQKTLVDLKKRYENQILCSFGAEKTYVFINTHKTYFELSIEKESDNNEQQKVFFDDLAECIGIIQTFHPVINEI
jgi:Ca2+/Na+ antiporter